ncbi:hypothetical protein R3W88_019676 [Solanum pinnatisectum]|uniref:Uncharacterized protein n=1 Tax=Solanum pinnatisectum TaxID=50273 RepID=A0AAV9KKA8_9SOLN|nr:hypothetical protein R3W88_019676 [Solanum pinnatisectum]
MKPINIDFHYIINNIRRRLAGWKTKFLNLTRRIVFAKVTLNDISFHVMQYIKLPTKIIDTISKVQRDFVWGTTAEKRKIHLLQWECITNTKCMGGLASGIVIGLFIYYNFSQ